MIQQVIRGRDSIKRVPEMMKALGMEHPLLIGSRHLLPKLQKAEALKDAPVFTGYHPNPDLGDAEEAVRMYRECGCDGLISIGGGSAMDTAKAVKAWLCSGGPEDLRKNRVNIPEAEKPARISSPPPIYPASYPISFTTRPRKGMNTSESTQASTGSSQSASGITT